MVKQTKRQSKFLQAVILHIFSYIKQIPFAEMRTYKKRANGVYQHFNCVCMLYALAKPLAEIETYKKTANVDYQMVNRNNWQFFFAKHLQPY
jgi:hypothetical protein